MWGDFYNGSLFKVVLQVCGKGNYGVSLFFVLSGFLITYLLMHEAKTKGSINIFRFFMRRLLRIWPVYFIVIGFGFLLFPELPFGIYTKNSGWMYAFFLSNIEEIRTGWNDSVNLLTVSWSVSIEEQFYMAWVTLMAVFPFLRKAKGFLPFLLLLVFASLVFRFIHADHFRTLYYHTFAVMSDLALGGLLAYGCFHWNIQERLANIPKWFTLTAYILGILAILGARKIFVGDLIVIEKVVLGFFFVFIIADQTFGKNSSFKADKLPFLFKIGTISYGFYMYHCIVLYYIQMLFQVNGWSENILHFILYFLTSLAGTLVVSSLSYRFVEKPILGLKRFF
jgi:peptidoglycan/LPS O-acetylase OafA/YrhL